MGFSLVISEYALKYAGLDSSFCSPKIPKRHIRCRMPTDPPNNASQKMFSKTQFCMGLWKNLGFSLVISEYALKYSG